MQLRTQDQLQRDLLLQCCCQRQRWTKLGLCSPMERQLLMGLGQHMAVCQRESEPMLASHLYWLARLHVSSSFCRAAG